MKFVVYAIAMLCTAAGFSQERGGAYLTKGNTSLVYNNGKDSIQLSNPDLKGFPMVNTAEIFAEVQIDGVGAKEVILKRSIEWVHMVLGDYFSYSEQTDRAVYEIWNIDSKEMLFSAVCANRFSYHRTQHTMPDSGGLTYYDYDFSIDNSGTVTIANLKISGPDTTTADHQEGVYTFKNGKYSKQ